MSTTRNRPTPGVMVHSGAPRSTTPPPAAPPEPGRGRTTIPGAPAPVRTAAELPDRRYFRIGEVAVLLGVKPYVLRYWETEFPQVRPQKSRSGQRLYRRREVESLLDIRTLLYERGFTIAGARKALREVEEMRAAGTWNGELAPLRSEPPPVTGTAVGAAMGSTLPGGEPAMASSAVPMVRSVPPPPAAASVAPVASAVPLPSLSPAQAEQLALQLSIADSRVLEELRDGLKDLLDLCREG